MKISIREALFSGEEVEEWEPPKSAWILAKPTGTSNWAPEVRNLKTYSSSNDSISCDYEVRVIDDDSVGIVIGDVFAGTLGCDYWYCELPDGKTIMMMTDSQIIRTNLEAIQEATVQAYTQGGFLAKKIKFK